MTLLKKFQHSWQTDGLLMTGRRCYQYLKVHFFIRKSSENTRKADQLRSPWGFHRPFNTQTLTPHALKMAQTYRGGPHPPTVFLHGVTPRSGTGYVSHLIGLHPDIHKHPQDIWEVPFLKHSDDLIAFRDHFFDTYPYNRGKIGDDDFFVLFGSAFIGYMYALTNPQQRLLLTEPGVEFLQYFYRFFPHEQLLLLMRDGRDVVESHIKTWSNGSFADYCSYWAQSARLMLQFYEASKNTPYQCWMGKYEEAFFQPEDFVKRICTYLGLEPSKYPYERIADIPVIGSSTFQEVQKGNWVSKPRHENFKPIGRWQQWSEVQKDIFKKIAGQTLIEAAYCHNLDW
ncbi:hypothetical protein U27_02125 [Candidatus Vecturithrix granuli]|uniref:Sulfotransferase n=1 Tax=Vecturithrix granuli TaxID=1499967 RepID=A0A0S6W6N1_VECG1|nr:hypothetical protein U27_02125 [Candidatus Vecturithrix granuli]